MAAVIGMSSLAVFASEELPEATIWFLHDRGIPKDSPNHWIESLVLVVGEDHPKYKESNHIDFDFTAKTNGDSEARLSIIPMTPHRSCHDETSMLEVSFADGKQQAYFAIDPGEGCFIISFLLNAKEFPTADITAMKVTYNLKGEHQLTKVFEKTMTPRFSEFFQTALWEIYRIHQGEMVASPFKGVRHGDLYY